MKLENQVVSLELAKKMKELGFEQESLYNWCEQFSWGARKPLGTFVLTDSKERIYKDQEKTLIHAYTVAELGKMLPNGFITYSFIDMEGATQWICEDSRGYGKRMGKNLTTHTEQEYTEADARAKMLIYLKEKNLLGETK